MLGQSIQSISNHWQIAGLPWFTSQHTSLVEIRRKVLWLDSRWPGSPKTSQASSHGSHGRSYRFHFIYGMSSFPLTNSCFSRCFFKPPTRYVFGLHVMSFPICWMVQPCFGWKFHSYSNHLMLQQPVFKMVTTTTNVFQDGKNCLTVQEPHQTSSPQRTSTSPPSVDGGTTSPMSFTDASPQVTRFHGIHAARGWGEASTNGDLMVF